MAKIIIIGAGLTGLSAAYHLEQQGFFDYQLLEKESQIGGLCKSVYQDGFTFDYTGHLLHINNSYFQELITNIFGFDNLHTIQRKSYIYSHDTYTPYPYQTNLYGLPPSVITDCIAGFIARKKKNIRPTNPKLYTQWVLTHFGAGLAKHFFFPYQQKIFDFNPKKLSSSWTGRFVPKTSLKSIIRGAVTQDQEAIGYNKEFFYPKQGGIFSLVKKLSEQLINPIQTNCFVKQIDLQTKSITICKTDTACNPPAHRQKNQLYSKRKATTQEYTEPFETIINTMPLDMLLNKLKEKSNTSVAPASKKLLCNSVTNFNIGIFSEQPYNRHWMYYPEAQYPFYRMGFYHNFSSSMAPSGCAALYGEIAHLRRSKQFVSNKLAQAIKAAQELLQIQDHEILTQKILHMPHAYVIYDLWREKHISKLHRILNTQHIYSIGRYGEWKYSSMQEAILDGKHAAEKILLAPQHKYWHIMQEDSQKRKLEKR